MRIATFGSCLSRYTANHYIRLFGGTLISSVYHNRSDAFVGRFIDKTWKTGSYERIATVLSNTGEYTPDNLPTNILKNQFYETIGKHRLSKGTPFMSALESNSIDLLIIDNYMDLSAKIISNEDFEGLFLRIGNIKFDRDHIQISDYLSPENAVKNMVKIINYIRTVSPGTEMVFLNFPYNTYSDNPERVERSMEYHFRFKYKDIHIVPPMTVPEQFQTSQKQHFKNQQYCAYAGLVHGLINHY